MKFGSLFSGIGGIDLGLERAGMQAAWQVEINPYCRRVLRRHWSQSAIFSDVRGFKSNGDEYIDLLCGGFPCQDLSVAGKRAGLKGERSGLFWEIIRIQKIVKAKWGLFENVLGLLSSNHGRDMWAVLKGLRECWPAVGYRILDSRYFGVAQRRRRVFFVCGPSIECVEQVLFESEGGRGNLAKGQKAVPRVAAGLRSRSHKAGINPPGRGGEEDMNIVISNALQERGGKGVDSDCTQTLVVGPLKSGGDTKRGWKIDAEEAASMHLIPVAEIGAKTQMGDGRNGCGIGEAGDPMFTLQAGKQHGVGVRRLTPTECERLQGFPDGWTCLCDKKPCECSDSSRYRALGNAVTVSVAEWIGRRIIDHAI